MYLRRIFYLGKPAQPAIILLRVTAETQQINVPRRKRRMTYREPWTLAIEAKLSFDIVDFLPVGLVSQRFGGVEKHKETTRRKLLEW